MASPMASPIAAHPFLKPLMRPVPNLPHQLGYVTTQHLVKAHGFT